MVVLPGYRPGPAGREAEAGKVRTSGQMGKWARLWVSSCLRGCQVVGLVMTKQFDSIDVDRDDRVTKKQSCVYLLS